MTNISSINIINFLTNLLYSVFLTTSYFTISLSLLESTGVVSNLPLSNLSTLCSSCYVKTA